MKATRVSNMFYVDGTLKLTQSPVALAMSSPIFLGERPRGPILGARADWAPTSPPVVLKWLWKCQNLEYMTGMRVAWDIKSIALLHDLYLGRVELWSYPWQKIGQSPSWWHSRRRYLRMASAKGGQSSLVMVNEIDKSKKTPFSNLHFDLGSVSQLD